MNKPTILLIDDDPDFVEATCAVLESVPYEVLIAYSGDEGVVKAREAQPNLIILDVIMPVEDGFQTLERLQADSTLTHIPVMMLTSLSDGLISPPASEAIAAIKDYIDKPIKPTELLKRVEKLLKQRDPSMGPATRNT